MARNSRHGSGTYISVKRPAPSPTKRRALGDVVHINPKQRHRAAALQADLDALLDGTVPPSAPVATVTTSPVSDDNLAQPMDLDDPFLIANNQQTHWTEPSVLRPVAVVQPQQHSKAQPSLTSRSLLSTDNWETLLPTLEASGGDVQLGGDGCFSLRHIRAAGNGPLPFSGNYFITPAELQAVKDRITSARTKPPRTYVTRISQEALDSCQASWDAANEKKQKSDPKQFDSTGVFVLTCRHSQVLFLADIDTPGEQQCYIVALLDKVVSYLPRSATILQAYDVGCALDHSCNLYALLAPTLRDRIAFVINIMHSFGHEWDCQLEYSPRFRPGMGISDMEGVERFWSRMRKLIAVTRRQWVSSFFLFLSNVLMCHLQNTRRIWMLDEHTAFINEEGCDNLGDWLDRQQTQNLLPKYQDALNMIRECQIPESELRQQWFDQKRAQRTKPTKRSARFRKELDKVIALQTEIEDVNTAIEEARKSIESAGGCRQSLAHLLELEESHMELSDRADALYASLNLRENFPQLVGLPGDFVKTLLVLHDLKISIRKRAVGSFYEMETLDRAVGGRKEALGTKLHQQTRKAMAKRHPVLYRQINRFNSLCEKIGKDLPADCNLPIPAPLPTRLAALRNDMTLYEDVCVVPAMDCVPRWIEDSDVRDGIQNMHVLDRCMEEMDRLNAERANLQRSLHQNAEVLRRCISSTTDDTLLYFLHRFKDQHLRREKRWKNAFGVYTLSPQLGGYIKIAAAYNPLPLLSNIPNANSGLSHLGSNQIQIGTAPPVPSDPISAQISSPPVCPTAALQASYHGNSMILPFSEWTQVPSPPPSFLTHADPSVGRSVPQPLLFPPSQSPNLQGDASNYEDLSWSSNTHGDVSDIDDSIEYLEAASDDEAIEILESIEDLELEDANDTSLFDISQVRLDIKWGDLPNLTFDVNLFQDLQCRNREFKKFSADLPHVITHPRGKSKITIEPEDLARFCNPRGLLSGHGINGVAASLQTLFLGPYSPYANQAQRCALLSTYELPRIRGQTPDSFLWKELEPTQYWEKDIWILPIHRPTQRHWVMAAAFMAGLRNRFFKLVSRDKQTTTTAGCGSWLLWELYCAALCFPN
ncbi:unnamed protein product [Mycena citricolor]|uniref:Ubiquitin-like protease family profile domain-containing protein n=1 Tax=Mycena citricolor TaxID=2018698 RepID=A0AAD2HJZ6_9AGAR|nr:unnamed protein product [Mycena citricolor]